MTCLLAALAAVAPSIASDQDLPRDLTEFSLEDLTRIKVTSVAKKQQTLSRVAAAIYVVTSEDIRRMGATSIPEALRFVPGLQVARIDANKWAVSARGFNGRFSNKLLVFIDGRSIYSPLFSGVFWEIYDLPMEDIERIEVVRGPGATMWGANALNGVINVITKAASETQGGLAAVQVGSLDGPISTVRYGGKGAGGRYRLSTKTQQRRSSPDDALSTPVEDGFRSMVAGFRYESNLNDRDTIEIHAGAHRMDGTQRAFAPILEPPFSRISIADQGASNSFVLGRWRRSISERSEASLQAYYDHVSKLENTSYRASVHVVDLDFQHRFQHGGRLELTWGGGYRAVADTIQGATALRVDEPSRRYQYVNAFVQEEIQILPEELYATVGAKFERHTFGGFASEPSARLLWAPTRRTAFWAAASRAARAPSRGERDVHFDLVVLPLSPAAPGLASLIPNPDLDYEYMTSFEAGFRASRNRWSLDVAVFDNHYRDVADFELLQPRLVLEPSPHFLIPVQMRNTRRGSTSGVEVSVKSRVLESLELEGSTTLLDPGAGFASEPSGLDRVQNPARQYTAGTHWRFRRDLELDLAAGYTGSIAAAGVVFLGQRLPSYVRGDARLEWTRPSGMRISVGVRDALRPGRYEFDPESIGVASPVGRNVYGRVDWGF